MRRKVGAAVQGREGRTDEAGSLLTTSSKGNQHSYPGKGRGLLLPNLSYSFLDSLVGQFEVHIYHEEVA
jgi:hypothetical protein